jgi:hypothetical protein
LDDKARIELLVADWLGCIEIVEEYDETIKVPESELVSGPRRME